MGMGIRFSPWGSHIDFHMDPHMGIPIWSHTHSIPTEILWEWDGYGNGNSTPKATVHGINIGERNFGYCKKFKIDVNTVHPR